MISKSFLVYFSLFAYGNCWEFVHCCNFTALVPSTVWNPHKLLSNTMNSFILGMSFPSRKHTILWRTLVIRWNLTAFSYSISYRVYTILEKWHIVARHTEAVNAVLMLLPYDFPDDVHSPELKYCQTLLCLLFTAPPSSFACLPLLSISLSNGLLVLMIFLVLLSYKPQCMRQFTLRSNKLLMLKLNKIVIHTHTHNAHWENIITLCSGYMLVSWWRYFRLFAITAAATTATIVTT